MVQMLNHLTEQGWLLQEEGQWTISNEQRAEDAGIPHQLRQLLARQFEMLPTLDQHLLEVASVAGDEFAAATLAVAMDRGLDQIELQCETIARRGSLIHETGLAQWPDGTVSCRYRFQHALYRQALYERVGLGRRLRLHRHIGARLEAAYGTYLELIASELAFHFTQSQDVTRAASYRLLGAETAEHRHAYRETVVHCTAGLTLLETVDEARASSAGTVSTNSSPGQRC